jgi:hypothetical protein
MIRQGFMLLILVFLIACESPSETVLEERLPQEPEVVEDAVVSNYVLRYHLTHLDEIRELSVPKGGVMTLTSLYVEGYTFEGWFLDAALSVPVDRVGPILSDIDLYPKFTKLLFDYRGLRNAAQEWYENDPNMDKYYEDPFLNIPNEGDFPWFLSNPSFIFVPDNPEKGFYIPYVIVLPREYDAEKLNYLLLTPNGTGERNEFHHNLGTFMRTQGWQGSEMEEIASNLNMIRLHPIVAWQCMWNTQYKDATFPSIMDLTSVLADSSNQDSFKRCTSSVDNPGDPASPPHTDVTEEEFARIIDVEQQMKLIIEDAVSLLNTYGYNVSEQVIGYGYSGSAAHITRLATVYPELFKAYFAGGTMKHIVPDPTRPYPYGVQDHEELFGHPFDAEAYKQIAKLSNFGLNDLHFPILDRGHNYDVFVSLYDNVLLDDYDNAMTAPDVYIDIAQHFLTFDVGGMFFINTEAGHYVTPSDVKLIQEFYLMNMESDSPVYPEDLLDPTHQLITINTD